MSGYMETQKKKNRPEKPLRLDESTQQEVRRGFGIDPGQLELGESPEVRAMGARAVAQGNVIQFAPGEFSPGTAEGRAVLGHELAHVRSQALGEVPMTGGLLQEPGCEAAADRVGDAFAAGGLAASGPVDAGALAGQNAPAQCIGRGRRVKNWLHDNMTSKSQRKLEEEYNEPRNGMAYNLFAGYRFSPFHYADSFASRLSLARKRSKEKKHLKEDILGLGIPENPLPVMSQAGETEDQRGTGNGENPGNFGLDDLFHDGHDEENPMRIAESTERMMREVELQSKRERLAELSRPGKVRRFFGRAQDRFTRSRMANRPQAPQSLGVGPQDPRIRIEEENRRNYPWLYPT